MSKYDRRILLPYLRNLYSMELAIPQLHKELKALHTTIEELEYLQEHDVPPQEMQPPSPSATIAVGFVSLLFLLISIVAGILTATYADVFLMLTATSVFTTFFCVWLFWRRLQNYSHHQQQYSRYCDKLADYQSRTDSRKMLQEQIAECNVQISILAEQINEASRLKRNLYALNVLPQQYRTLDTVQYLYEYFRTSKANDIDTVLQIYAVEHIRSKQERLSEKQSALVLNHRCRIADQVNSDPLQKQYYEEQMINISNQEQDPELKNQYIRMLAEDLSVSQFFSFCTLVQHE